MRLTLGRLGCGGGPLAFLFSPLGRLEALILQEQVRHQRHPRVPMQMLWGRRRGDGTIVAGSIIDGAVPCQSQLT
jgi:hypothetical protein